jgi:hypothetical protein
MMSFGVASKIYLRDAKPNTHTWWLRPPTSFLGVGCILEHFLPFGFLLWEVAHDWSFGCFFGFCNREQLVPLSANLYPKPSHLRKTKKKQSKSLSQAHFLSMIKCLPGSRERYYRPWEVCFKQTFQER